MLLIYRWKYVDIYANIYSYVDEKLSYLCAVPFSSIHFFWLNRYEVRHFQVQPKYYSTNFFIHNPVLLKRQIIFLLSDTVDKKGFRFSCINDTEIWHQFSRSARWQSGRLPWFLQGSYKILLLLNNFFFKDINKKQRPCCQTCHQYFWIPTKPNLFLHNLTLAGAKKSTILTVSLHYLFLPVRVRLN